jgi:7-carboxy-7-deazaguanine synthase
MKKIKERRLPVIEIYNSIQGEGLSVGTPSIFLRTAGCNLKCSYCDTKFAWKKNKAKRMLLYNVAREIKNIRKQYANLNDLVITGGEPMLYAASINDLLFNFFTLKNRPVITIETNGSLFSYISYVNLWSVSPKLDQIDYEYMKSLKAYFGCYKNNIQVKILIDSIKDFEITRALLMEVVPVTVPIIFQPMWKKREDYAKKVRLIIKMMYKWFKTRNDNYRVIIIPQLHKLIYGNRRRR